MTKMKCKREKGQENAKSKEHSPQSTAGDRILVFALPRSCAFFRARESRFVLCLDNFMLHFTTTMLCFTAIVLSFTAIGLSFTNNMLCLANVCRVSLICVSFHKY